MAEDMILCPFCGAYSPRQCEMIDDAGCCPWEEMDDAAQDLANELDDGNDSHG